jgi:hypothetical protein
MRRAPVRSLDFGWLLALIMATTLVVIPMFAPYNQVLLIPVLMVVARAIRGLWADRVSRFFVMLTALVVIWPWMAAVGLLAALTFEPGAVVQKAWALPLFTNFAIPTLTLGLVLIGGKAMRSGE